LTIKMPLLLLTLTFSCSVLGAWLVSKFACRINCMDIPSERSSHCAPTPKGGGIGILSGLLLMALLLSVPTAIWLFPVIISLTGFIGDRRELSPSIRLLIQMSAALAFLISNYKSTVLFSIIESNQLSHYGIYAILLFSAGMVFIAGTTNFYNFMDGIDGIAGITGSFAFFFLGIYGSVTVKDSTMVLLAFGSSAACIGFLTWNFPRAKVFMGDVGSTLLGFLFSIYVLLFSSSAMEFIALSSILFPFYADELTTMYERIRNGEDLSKPHRKHLYQVLANEIGMAHWKISLIYGAIQFLVTSIIWTLFLNELFLLEIIVLTAFTAAVFLIKKWVKTVCD
jgi:Fuc2NAc and GlcNAc transferase